MRLLLVSLFLLFISFHAQAEKSIKADSPLLCPTIVDDSSEGIDCWRKSFLTAIAQSDYAKVNQWLEQDAIRKVVAEHFTHDFLGMLFCKAGVGTEIQNSTKSETDFEGGKPIKSEHKKVFIKITEQLLLLGASFEAMPSQQIVTTLFCATNNRDSEMLEYMLMRTHVDKKELDSCLYEGSDPSHVPIFRTIENDDLESAKILLQHGASLNYREMETTPLIHALKLKRFSMAEWLLDMGASVYETDDGKCTGKLPIAYAREIPVEESARDAMMVRIESLMQVLPNPCKRQ